MNQQAIKQQAKKLVNSNFKFYFLLILPVVILQFISEAIQIHDQVTDVKVTLNSAATTTVTTGSPFDLLISLITSLLIVGILYVLIDVYREKETFDNPLRKSFTIFSSGEYFISGILLGLLQVVWILLWSLLFIIPGIIKLIAYSQAYFIYRDALDADQKITYRDAITESRMMMDGHKWEYFIFNLSFIGWWLLVVVTLGLAAIWVQPYYYTSIAGYYVELNAQYRSQHDNGVIYE